MHLLQKATDVTAGPASTSGHDVAAWLREQYAYPPDRTDGLPHVRANMVTTIDGAATADGRSGGLGSPGDRMLFQLLREISDTVLIGASTALKEDYGLPEPAADGTRPALVLASRSLSIPDDYAPAFDSRTLIATCAQAPTPQRARLTELGATLIDCGADTVEPARLVAALGDRGRRRVICEGGPRLLAEFVAAGALDQLAVTLGPSLAGGNGPRIAHGASPGDGLAPARLHHLIGDDEGFLYFLWDTGAAAGRAADD
ncbi:dihydrofolate reductase family protein [Gordonia caeni]|uniref:Pyrimidine reductase family protein n=1 Tax=Gordonia caeni TaxID=1007097 RepID=A0ABP7P6P0_9ACTN